MKLILTSFCSRTAVIPGFCIAVRDVQWGHDGAENSAEDVLFAALQETEEDFMYRIGDRTPSISARLAGKLAFWRSKPFKIPADLVSDHHRDGLKREHGDVASIW